jgi:HSP20 family protein
VREKKELETKEEETKIGRFFVPVTDIHETPNALMVTMEMPGVEKKNIDINLEKNILAVTGNIDFSTYDNMEPLYTEYNVGNYARRFTISSKIDRDGISATMEDGVLTITLPKHEEATTRQIKVQ